MSQKRCALQVLPNVPNITPMGHTTLCWICGFHIFDYEDFKTATFGEVMPRTPYKFIDIPKERLPPASCRFLGRLLDPEDDSNMFLRNVGQLLPDHAAVYPRSWHST